MRDLHTVQEAVQVGTKQDAQHQRLYRKWAKLCYTLSVNPTLQYSSLLSVDTLQVYGHRFRHAHYSKQHLGRLGKVLVSQAWGAIEATHLLDGLPDPRNPPDAQAHTRLYRHLILQLKTYTNELPPVNQKKAAPLGIVHSISASASTATDPKTCHVTDLVQLVFYFCPRSCKYNKYI